VPRLLAAAGGRGMTTARTPRRPVRKNAGSRLEDVAAVREALRQRARASLGVTGVGSTTPMRIVRREFDLSYYPLAALAVLYLVDGFQGYAFQVLAPDISR